MIILTLNCGSSSAKYQLYDWSTKKGLATGIVERVGIEGSVIIHKVPGKEELKVLHPCPSHVEAIQLIMDTLVDPEKGAIASMDEVKAVGHRVVHGGEKFKKSVIVDDAVLEEFRSIQSLAPLHNPANIMGIEAARTVLPGVPHCAIMDTAWHQTMPSMAYTYALPYSWYRDHGVRRYGFHGTSFLYTAKRAAVLLGKDPFETNVVIAHIGNGASVCAVKNGVSVDTSMGLTPLEGLIMGTRCGDIDPAIPFYMMNRTGMSPADMENTLNKKSGVLGITERFVDRRDIEDAAAQGDELAQLSIDAEGYRIRKYIGAYAAATGGIDAVVFTAGVGERGPQVRTVALRGLSYMGITIDEERNELSMTRNAETVITTDDSPVKAFVIPTDEELVMTEDTYALVQGTYDVHTNFTYSFQKPDYVNAERAASVGKDCAKRPGLDKIIVTPPASKA
ncbi:propionate kinase [Alkalispirochaeta sphaeroplastigenens]|uniref:Acetate kinase n=1 Tax=Alkalispirochaeta sphaeroplastigenens TaxID=1187066 RepID=A0A2S4JQ64_9SPIO|nr:MULTISPECIES: acetate kinase [Alkalispirochaeta]POR01622.1 propionate kinase [Alkalispirochaeta sphaeroplastigenens]